MAALIKSNGIVEIVRPAKKKFTRNEMYKLLDCQSIEAIKLPGGTTMWVDEDGKLKTNIMNLKATAVLHAAGARPGIVVVGDVLICDRGEVA